MSNEPPPGCTYQAGDATPLTCLYRTCRYHCAHVGARGPLPRRRLSGRDDCALTVANRGGLSRGDVADLLGISAGTVQNVENAALVKIRFRMRTAK